MPPSTQPRARLVLPDSSELLLTDTVGFVRKLPHRFVEAFKSTLEEAVVSDFLLHVVDSSSPDAAEHIKTTASVLRELGADSKKIIVVMNKIDALSDDVSARALEIEFPDAVWVSAKTGEGLGGLLAKMEDAIAGASKLVKLLVPHSEYRAVAELYASGPVLSRRDTDDGRGDFSPHSPAQISAFRKMDFEIAATAPIPQSRGFPQSARPAPTSPRRKLPRPPIFPFAGLYNLTFAARFKKWISRL